MARASGGRGGLPRGRNARRAGEDRAPRARGGGQGAEQLLTIERLTAGGAGLGRDEQGRPLFVRGVLPGERVRARPPAEGKLWELVELVDSSNHRREPRCPEHARCGGCDWMHVSPAERRAAYAAILEELLRRTGQALPEIRVVSPTEERGYRGRARFLVRVRKGRTEIGYRARASHELVPIASCEILEPGLLACAQELAACLTDGAVMGDVSVAWQRRADGEGLVAHLDLDRDLSSDALRELYAMVERGALAGVSLAVSGAAAPIRIGDPRPAMIADDGLTLWFSAGGFAQASSAGARHLAARVLALAEPAGKEVLELFSGAGTLSVGLARAAQRFSSVESDPDAVVCARENLALRQLPGKLSAGDAGAWAIPKRVDCVVLDPPRQGAREVVATIAEARTKSVVYVSCDMATFARDAIALCASGYELDHLEVADLFPQTSHAETIARFRRAGRASA